MAQVLIIGAGRAGSSLARALRDVGCDVEGPVGRGYDLTTIAAAITTIVIATSDDAISSVAAKIPSSERRLVVHLSGSLGVDALAPHPRRASLHPLVPLPTTELGAQRLTSGITFAVAGDTQVQELVSVLRGKVLDVDDDDRVRYHAAACVAANHVVALMGHVERIAASAGLPLEAFLDLTRAAVDDVARFGPRNALTGPVSRGDWATLDRHVDSLDPSERASYRAGVGLALELVATRDQLQQGDDPVEELPEVRSASGASLVG